MKNKHLEHIEDQIVNLGSKGANQVLELLTDMTSKLSGHVSNPVDVTVKWDGSPAIVCGRDPETGYFFIATKHAAFSEGRGLCFNHADIEAHYEGKGVLVDILKLAFDVLRELPFDGVLQGDIMFTDKSKKYMNISGTNYITFKPNTILYAFPESSNVGTKIQSAHLGVVFHTTYTGGPTVKDMSARFGTDVSRLRATFNHDLWIGDATYKNQSGLVTLTVKDTTEIKQKLALAKISLSKCSHLLDTLANKIDNPLSIGYLFKLYVNSLIRKGELSKEMIKSGLTEFIIGRIEQKERSVKTAVTKAKYAGLAREVNFFLRDNQPKIDAMVDLYDTIIQIKNHLIEKLDKASNVGTFIETENGLQLSSPEGYVAIDKEGNAVKFVNRLEFSTANFNAVRDWDPKIPKLRTMVFAYGRFNPPTYGHHQLLRVVLDKAKELEADHLIIVSHKQDNKTNPLSPTAKLTFFKEAYSQFKFKVTASSPTKPSFIQFLKEWDGKYDRIVMVAGSDRVAEYEQLINKYNGREFTFKIAEVVSAGERDPDADDVTGMSASKAREAARRGDFNTFKKCLSPGVQAKYWYNEVRKGLGITK